MLSSAVELLNLVRRQQSVTWTDIRSVDGYIFDMRKIMEKISLENQTLANYHQVISNKVNGIFFFAKIFQNCFSSFYVVAVHRFKRSFQIINLMSTDILREQDQWKLGLKTIRNIVRQVEEKVMRF